MKLTKRGEAARDLFYAVVLAGGVAGAFIIEGLWF